MKEMSMYDYAVATHAVNVFHCTSTRKPIKAIIIGEYDIEYFFDDVNEEVIEYVTQLFEAVKPYEKAVKIKQNPHRWYIEYNEDTKKSVEIIFER